MSGWSTATATVNYDYPWNSENPSSETGVTMVPFNHDGSQADPATTFTAPVGDFIPVGLGTLIAVSNPSTVSGILTYDESEFSVTYPNGDYIPSGEEISLSPAETIIDVSVNSSNTDLDGEEVDDDITFAGKQFTSVSLNTCSVEVDFKPLQMYNNGTQIAGSYESGLQNVNVGQLMSLQVKDPAGFGGIVTWSMPGGSTVKNYDPTGKASKLTYLNYSNLQSVAIGHLLSNPALVRVGRRGNRRVRKPDAKLCRDSLDLQPVWERSGAGNVHGRVAWRECSHRFLQRHWQVPHRWRPRRLKRRSGSPPPG